MAGKKTGTTKATKKQTRREWAASLGDEKLGDELRTARNEVNRLKKLADEGTTKAEREAAAAELLKVRPVFNALFAENRRRKAGAKGEAGGEGSQPAQAAGQGEAKPVDDAPAPGRRWLGQASLAQIARELDARADVAKQAGKASRADALMKASDLLLGVLLAECRPSRVGLGAADDGGKSTLVVEIDEAAL